MYEIKVGAPVASKLKKDLYGIVTQNSGVFGTYSVCWDMGGFGATTHEVHHDELIECEWRDDSEPS